MLGQTGRDLEKRQTKRGTQQEDKRTLNTDGTQTERQEIIDNSVVFDVTSSGVSV